MRFGRTSSQRTELCLDKSVEKDLPVPTYSSDLKTASTSVRVLGFSSKFLPEDFQFFAICDVFERRSEHKLKLHKLANWTLRVVSSEASGEDSPSIKAFVYYCIYLMPYLNVVRRNYYNINPSE